MKNFGRTFGKFVFGFIVWLGILFTGFLFISSLLYDSYSTDMETQIVLYRRDNPLWTVFVVAVVVILTVVCTVMSKKWGEKALKWHLTLTVLWVFVLGCLGIFFFRTVPAADAMSVYAMAESLSQGDLSFIHPTQSYLAYYPHQIGLVVFFAPFIYVFNLLKTGVPAYFFLELINVFFACVTVVFQYETVERLAPHKSTLFGHIYLILIGLFFPFIAYTSFVYGEIPSVMFMSMALYFSLRLKERLDKSEGKTVSTACLMTLCAVASVFVRKNSLIFIIALSAVLFVDFICRRKAVVLVSLVLAVLLSVFGQGLLLKVFENAKGVKFPSGVTPLSYVAMSMKSDTRAKGWYDGYNFETYRLSGMDKNATDAASKAVIKERLEFFKANKGEMYSFYKEKYLSQWADGTYASRQAILASLGRREYVWPYFNGPEAFPYINFCNGFQSLFYAGLLLFCIFGVAEIKKESANIVRYIGIIALFGTFLFHILWEANSRYSFPMVAIAITCAAAGWGMTVEAVLKRFRVKRSAEVTNEE